MIAGSRLQISSEIVLFSSRRLWHRLICDILEMHIISHLYSYPRKASLKYGVLFLCQEKMIDKKSTFDRG